MAKTTISKKEYEEFLKWREENAGNNTGYADKRNQEPTHDDRTQERVERKQANSNNNQGSKGEFEIKPIIEKAETDEEADTYECSNCGEELEYGQVICPNCQSALDWNDISE